MASSSGGKDGAMVDTAPLQAEIDVVLDKVVFPYLERIYGRMPVALFILTIAQSLDTCVPEEDFLLLLKHDLRPDR